MFRSFYVTNFIFFTGIGAFLGFGIDIFYKEKPKVTFNRNTNDGLPSTIINERNFLFTINDQYSNQRIPDFERRFTVSFDYNQINDGSVKKTLRIPFEKCSNETLKYWEGYFSSLPKENYLCFPKGKQWELSGIDNQGNFTRIRMQMEYCMNNTDPTIGALGSNCIPKEDTIKLLKGKRIQMHYIIENWLINSFDFSNPGRRTAYTGYAHTDALSWGRLYIYFKEILSDTDEGYFTVSKKQETFTAIESIDNEAIYSPESSAIFSHLIGNSRYKETYYRSYIKIQDVFAMMGEFLSAAVVIFRSLVNFYVLPLLANIFNDIIKLEAIPGKYSIKNLNILTSQKRRSNVISNSTVKNPSSSGNNFTLYNSDFSRVNNYVSMSKKAFNSISDTLDIELLKNTIKNISNKNFKNKVVIWERFLPCFNKNNEKLRLYKRLTMKMEKFLSFENLLKLTKDTKILKNVVFNNDSLKYISRLCLYPEKSSKEGVNEITLQENFIELVKMNDQNAIYLLKYLNRNEKNEQSD